MVVVVVAVVVVVVIVVVVVVAACEDVFNYNTRRKKWRLLPTIHTAVTPHRSFAQRLIVCVQL